MEKKLFEKNGRTYLVTSENYKTELEWAKKTAYSKTCNTIDTWQKRSDCKRFTNLFLGDLAKNIFKKFILEIRPQFVENIVEYDLIRNDDFRNPDQFDLRVEKDNQYCNIEVKSSAEKSIQNINELVNKRRIIINIGNQHQHFECFAVQVLFVPENLDFFKNEDINCGNLDIFVQKYVNEFNLANVNAYIVGYATEQMQKDAVNNLFRVQNMNANANKRNYADLIISQTHTPDEFIYTLDNMLANKK